jgi:hypothetical protein
MKYLIKGKIIVLLLSIILLTNSCVEMYCVLSDSGGDFCGDVLMKADERRKERYKKEKEKEHRKKMEEINKNNK